MAVQETQYLYPSEVQTEEDRRIVRFAKWLSGLRSNSMTSVKELCNTLRPGESISIDRSEGGFSIRASLEGKVVFSNHVHLDLLEHHRFNEIFRIILDSVAEVRQFRTEQEKHGVQGKVGQSVTLDLEGRQDVDELFAAYRDFREAYLRERKHRLQGFALDQTFTKEQMGQSNWHWVPPELPPVDTEVASAYEKKAEEMAQAMRQRLREWECKDEPN